MMQSIQQYIKSLPSVKAISPEQNGSINNLVSELCLTSQGELDNQTVEMYKYQLDKLFQALNTPLKMTVLGDANHRALIISFIRQQGIEHYKYSYFNRAKLTQKHLEKLTEVGPILFSEAVMIASKLNTINKNSSRIFIQDHLYTESQSPVDLRIQQILKLCDEKKRIVNSNLKKLELILERPEHLQVIKQLGKMLRDSWKKDKSKVKCIDVVKEPAKKIHEENIIAPMSDDQSIQQNAENMETDKFSFTSSQEQIFKNQRQYAKARQKNKGQNNIFLIDFSDCNSQQRDYFDYQLSI